MRGFWKRLLAVLLVMVGLALLYGGAILLRAGGSTWYVLGGSAVLATGIGLWRENRRAAPIYALFLAATLAWSLWEVGLDGWALAPRLIGPALVGLLLVAAIGNRANRWLLASAGASLGAVALAGILAVLPGGLSPPPLTAPLAGSKGPLEWRHWGQSEGGRRYAETSQISTGNVKDLELAWRFTSDVAPQPYVSFEATPLMADGRLYTCLQPGIVVALDPDSGRELWRHVSPAYARADFTPIFGGKCRGVSYSEAPRPLPRCSRRVLFAAPDGTLMALDAADGRACRDFGKDGAADLREGMGLKDGEILAMPSSPPVIVGGLAVIGQTVSDLGSFDAPSGVIRAYDAETGDLRWAWDAGRPGQSRLLPGETYTADTPNAWGVLSADPALGLVFVPTGNSLPDYYGGQRSATLEKYATSVVALDVATGQPRWHFQTVHHDLWDYDVASQPVPVDLPGANGATRAALIVPTKRGQIFVLDRATGKPIDRVEERPVPQGGVPGERTAPTQPFTTGFPSLSGPDLAERDAWGLTPLDQLWCRIRFRQAHYRGQFTPVGTSDTLMYPGTAGGINWGSVTIDPARGLMVVNTLRFANFGKLIPRKDAPKHGYGGA